MKNLKHPSKDADILHRSGVNANGLKLNIAAPKLFERAFEKVHGECRGD